MEATTRGSIDEVRKAAFRAGDNELLNLCIVAEDSLKN